MEEAEAGTDIVIVDGQGFPGNFEIPVPVPVGVAGNVAKDNGWLAPMDGEQEVEAVPE